LLALADQNIERLNAKLEVHEQSADAQAERTFARLSFDPSPEGEALRKYLIKCTNGLLRGMATYRKYKAGARSRLDEASGLGRTGVGWGVEGGGGHGTQTELRTIALVSLTSSHLWPHATRSPHVTRHPPPATRSGADDSFGSG